MKRNDKDNTELMSQDWACNDRQGLLKSIGGGKTQKEAIIAGINARIVRMSDVSGDDPRSAKAYLAGRGDLHTAWWNLNRRLHNPIFTDSTLEHVMFHFHRRHGAATLWRLELARDCWAIVDSVRNDGILEEVGTGVLEYWSTGVLEYWSTAISRGVQEWFPIAEGTTWMNFELGKSATVKNPTREGVSTLY